MLEVHVGDGAECTEGFAELFFGSLKSERPYVHAQVRNVDLLVGPSFRSVPSSVHVGCCAVEKYIMQLIYIITR